MAGRCDIIIHRGAAFELKLTLTDEDTADPIDLSGKSARFIILNKQGDTIVLTASAMITAPLAGAITLRMSETQSTELRQLGKSDDPFYLSEDYIYHMDVLDSDGTPRRYLYGVVSVQR